LECKPDETLAVALGIPAKAIVHSHSKGRVARSLTRSRHALGLVDEDFAENEPSSLRRFVEVSWMHEIRHKVDRENDNQLVIISPRLEPWLLKTTRLARLDMEQFNLGRTLRDLDADINHRLSNLQRLLQELLTASSARLLHLQTILTHGKSRQNS
jgi:hypothetical protein